MKNEKTMKKVVVHGGLFHCDDVLCVAILAREYGLDNIQIVRTRDKALFEDADFVLDVGDRSEITEKTIFFDHHGSKEYYENGVAMAACGKLARYFKYPQALWDHCLYSVEAQDNGQKWDSPNPFSFVNTLNVNWEQNLYGPEQDKAFELAVSFSLVILNKIFEDIESEERAKEIVENSLGEGEIVVMPCYVGGWQKYLCEYNNTHKDKKLLVVYPSGGNYNVQVVPVTDKVGETKSHIKLPHAWGGLRDGELEKVSKISGAVFCHSGIFLSVWNSKEAALHAAKFAIAAARTSKNL